MHIPWTGKRCILCLKEVPLSAEHLIPVALGGVLTCDLLCKDCNSTLGSSFEAEVRMDPDIQIAVRKLEDQIPDKLAESISEGQPVRIQGPGGERDGKIRNGKSRVNFEKERIPGSTSYVQPSDDAITNVENMMRKAGVDENQISVALRELEEAPNDHSVILTPWLSVTKWSEEKITPDLTNNKIMNPLVPLKIAFEFLACHVGTAIYNENQHLNQLRAALREGTKDDPCFKVERLFASEYKPFHGICFEGNDPHARVQIRLFGHLAFRVHFLRLSVSGPRWIYTQSPSHPPELLCLDNAGVSE